MKLFTIISDAGLLKAGNIAKQKLDELKANGFEKVNHGEDFLNTLTNGEYAVFIPESEEDIESLYDETNMYSLSYTSKERILHAYKA